MSSINISIKGKVYPLNETLRLCKIFKHCDELAVYENNVNPFETKLIEIDDKHYDAFMMIYEADFRSLYTLLDNFVQYNYKTEELILNRKIIDKIEDLYKSFLYLNYDTFSSIHDKIHDKMVKYYKIPLKHLLKYDCDENHENNFKCTYHWDSYNYRYKCSFCKRCYTFGHWECFYDTPKQKYVKDKFYALYNTEIFSFDHMWKKPLEYHMYFY